MAKYRTKTRIVEAEQWLPKREEWPGIGIPDKLGVVWEFGPDGMVSGGFIETLQGKCIVSWADWIISNDKGQKYAPRNPDEFADFYEPVTD